MKSLAAEQFKFNNDIISAAKELFIVVGFIYFKKGKKRENFILLREGFIKKKKIWNFPYLGFDPPPVKIWIFFYWFSGCFSTFGAYLKKK